MKLRIGILLVVAFLATSGVGVLIYWRGMGARTPLSAEGKQELTLARPVFDSSMAAVTTTLDEEAGMAIWLNATENAPLNLTDAMSGMVNETNTTEYVIGSISLQFLGFPSDDWPHCFVHQNGWVVVYYIKPNPANPSTAGWIGKMIALNNSDWYDMAGHELKDNLLHKSLVLICYQLHIFDTSSAQYYHFQYPSATKLELAIKSAGNDQTQTFNIKVPSSFKVYERSWSFYSVHGGSLKINATQIPIQTARDYGGPEITEQLLAPDAWQTVTLSAALHAYGNYATACIIILYHD